MSDECIQLDSCEWESVEKRPVVVEFCGPFTSAGTVKTLEGEFVIDEEYLEEHIGYVVVRGLEGEVYPVALDVFTETYVWPDGSEISLEELGE